MVQTKLTCPLGSECERVKDGVVERCAWYTELSGQNPQTGEQMYAVSKCALTWLPILLVEGNGKTNEVGAAVESLRNVVAETPPIRLIMNNDNQDTKLIN